MKHLKTFEKIGEIDKPIIYSDDKGKKGVRGIYFDDDDIIKVINYLKDKKVKHRLLYGTDDIYEDDCFLVLIEDTKNLPYTFSNYYIPFKNDYKVFLNWLYPDTFIDSNFLEITTDDIDELETFLASKKYNL